MKIKMKMVKSGFYFGPDGEVDGDWGDQLIVNFWEINKGAVRASDQLSAKYIRLAKRMKLDYWF